MKPKFLRPLKLKTLELPSNVWCAPLAGCSDLPFRAMTSAYKPGLVFCEMVKMDALVRHDPHTYRMLEYTAGMHPIGAQLCGSKPAFAGAAAKIIEELGFDVVDLNCGCPVDKVTKDGSGSGMLKQPMLIGEVISQMVAAVRIPVTVKIRLGWDQEHRNAPDIVRIAETAGASAITVHGRTRAQGYQGEADRSAIAECVAAARNILVIGNGDIMSAESACDMFAQTGCDGILLARGVMGAPQLVEQVMRGLNGEKVAVSTEGEILQLLFAHLEHIAQCESPDRAFIDMKRVACYYLKGLPRVKEVRIQLQQARSCSEVWALLQPCLRQVTAEISS